MLGLSITETLEVSGSRFVARIFRPSPNRGLSFHVVVVVVVTPKIQGVRLVVVAR